MAQELFPEVEAATQALEQRITITEQEIGEMKESITQKKRLVKGWKKAIAAVRPKPAGQKSKAAAS
jgi:hypothetical protein